MRFTALRNYLEGKPSNQEDEGQEQDGAGTGEGEGGEEEEEGAGEGAGDASDSAASTAAAVRAATMAERKRWATVLTSTQAEGQEETACAMLVEDMSAAAILRVLGNAAPKNAVASRLRQTPRANIGGAAPQSEGRDSSAAAESRKKAIAATNNRVGRNAKVTSAKKKVGLGTKES